MSDTFTLPPLLTADGQLTDAGQQLVKFANAKVREQRRDDVFDTFAGERYRAWFAATMKSPPLQTPEQFIAAYYKNPTGDNVAALWLDFLNTLTPEARARAQIVPAAAPTQEAVVSESRPMRLIESVDDLPRFIEYQRGEQMNAAKRELDRLISSDGQPLWGNMRSPDDLALIMNFLRKR